MFISPRAIKAFVERPLRDSNLWKEKRRGEIKRRYEALAPPGLAYPPRHHQRVGFILGAKYNRYLFFGDPGTGKSWLALALYRYARWQVARGAIPGQSAGLKAPGKAPHSPPALNRLKPRMLVLVPNASNVGQWVDEAQKQWPQGVRKIKAQGVDGSGAAERWGQILAQDADIAIVTYMGLLSLACNSDKKPGKAPGKGWRIDPAALAKIAKHFSFITYDEATAFSNPQSLTYRACRKLSFAPSTTHAYALTGTPFGADPHDLWAIFNVIDGGETLGETLGLFRAAFFTDKQNFWGGTDWKFDERKKGKLARLLRARSLRYTEAECGDLPALVEIDKPVVFAPETWKYYDVLITQLADQGQALSVSDSPFHRLRFLTAGFLSLKTSVGEKQVIKFATNPKLDAMLDDLGKVPPGRKIIIFHWYRESGNLICEALRKRKIKFARLGGGGSKKLKTNIAHELEKVRVLVSSSAGAVGGNFQVANYIFMFEPPCDPKTYKQMSKRIHRIGQSRRCFIYRYAVRGSVDQRIYKAIDRGENLFRSIIDGKKAAAFLRRREE